jgi:hypothetical protein
MCWDLAGTTIHSYQLLYPIGLVACGGDCVCGRACRLGRRRRQATFARLGGQPIVSASAPSLSLPQSTPEIVSGGRGSVAVPWLRLARHWLAQRSSCPGGARAEGGGGAAAG